MDREDQPEVLKGWGCKYLPDEVLDNAPIDEGAEVLGDYLFANIQPKVWDAVSEELAYIVPLGLSADVQEGIMRINRDYVSFKANVLTDALTWHVQLLEDERTVLKSDQSAINGQGERRAGMRFLTDTLFLGPEVRAIENLFKKSDAIQYPGIQVHKSQKE